MQGWIVQIVANVAPVSVQCVQRVQGVQRGRRGVTCGQYEYESSSTADGFMYVESTARERRTSCASVTRPP